MVTSPMVLQAQCGKGPHLSPCPHTPFQGSWGWLVLQAEKRSRYSFGHVGEKILQMGGNPQIRLFNLGLTPIPDSLASLLTSHFQD